MAHGTETSVAVETGPRAMLRRVVRVFLLDGHTYDEIERDPHGTRQAAMIVSVVALAAVIATILSAGWHAGAIAGAIVAALIHWLVWSILVYLVASVLFRAPTNLAAVVKGLGYAQAPQIIAVLGFIPVVGPVIVLVGRVFAFIVGHHAMEHTLRISRTRVMLTTLVTFLITFAIAGVVRAVLGDIQLLDGLSRP